MNPNAIPYHIPPSDAFKNLTTSIQTNIIISTELMKLNINLQNLLNDKKKECEMLEKKNNELQKFIDKKQNYIDECIDTIFMYEMKLNEYKESRVLVIKKEDIKNKSSIQEDERDDGNRLYETWRRSNNPFRSNK